MQPQRVGQGHQAQQSYASMGLNMLKSGASATWNFLGSVKDYSSNWLTSKTWSYPGEAARMARNLMSAPSQARQVQDRALAWHDDLQPLGAQRARDNARYVAAANYVYSGMGAKLEYQGFKQFRGAQHPEHAPVGEDRFELRPIAGLEGDNTFQGFHTLDNLQAYQHGAEQYYADPATGLKFTVLQDDPAHQDAHDQRDEIIVSFAGFGPTIGGVGRHNVDRASDGDRRAYQNFKQVTGSRAAAQLAGFVPEVYRQADEAIQALRARYPHQKIVIAGNSYAGSIAQYAGLMQAKRHGGVAGLNMEVRAFNSLAMGVGLQGDIGDATLRRADQMVTHISVSGDWASDPAYGYKTSSWLDTLASSAGLRTPGNFGRRFVTDSYDPGDYANQRHARLDRALLLQGGLVQPPDHD